MPSRPTPPVRRALAVAACLAVPLVVAGCGSDEPAPVGAIDTDWFGSTSPQDVLATASTAMRTPVSFRLQQQARAADGVLDKDLLVSDGGDCTGQLQLPAWSAPADLVVLDGDGAFRGDRAFWLAIKLDLGDDSDVESDLRAGLADSYGDRWTTTAGLDTLCEIADFLRPLAGAVADADGVKDGLADVEGEPAGRVVSKQGDTTVTTWVALAAPHRVLRIAVSHGEGAAGADGPVAEEGDSVTTFSDFGASVVVDFPDADEIETFELPTVSGASPDETVTDQ